MGTLVERTAAWLRSERAPLVVCAVLAALPRVWLALTDHSVFWPDEVYQSLEPAHRAAFGYGLLSWEFRDGARSWLLPGLLALVLKPAALFTSSSLILVCTLKLLMVAWAVTGVIGSVIYGGRLAGRPAAWLAGLIACTFPPLLVYSHRATPEMASAPLLIFAALWLLPTAPDARRAGLAAGLAVAFRIQTAPVAALFLIHLVVKRRWSQAREFATWALLVTGLGGLLDWVTWGVPFSSTLTYVKFNAGGGASTFGVEPASYFVQTFWTSSALLFPALLIGLVLAAYKAPGSISAIVAFVGSHAVIPHKEFRFLMPIMPLAIAVAAVGLTQALSWLRVPHWAAVALGLVALTAGAGKASRLTNGDLGHYLGLPFARERVWSFEEEPTLLLAAAGRQHDVCGVATLGLRAGFTGGYSYLHRKVPLMYRHQICDEATAANYIIARSDASVPEVYVAVEKRGPYSLFRRNGSCALPDDFDYMLEGADDMGLYPAPVQQPDKRELRVSAGTSAAAFKRGFSHGERLECRRVRWAVGTSSEIQFDLEPTGQAYRLSLTAQPYGPALPQTLSVSLNGAPVEKFPMEAEWHGYQALVPATQLRRGRNSLGFEFTRAVRAQGNDTRELAALFDQIVITPLVASVVADVGTDEGRSHLTAGFSGDERSGMHTVAWSSGPNSRVTMTIAGGSEPHVLSVVALAYHPVASQPVTVKINGRAAGLLSFPARWTRRALLLPPGLVRGGTNEIEFVYARTVKPVQAQPGASDTRDLAVMYDEIALQPLPLTSRIDFGTAGAHVHQLDGFSLDEPNAQPSLLWNDGATSALGLRLDADDSPRRIRIDAQAFPPAMPQKVELRVQGKLVGQFEPVAKLQRFHVDVPAGAFSGSSNVLELRYSRTVRPSDVAPDSQDDRELAVRFDTLEIVKLDPTDEPVELYRGNTP